MKRVLSCRLRLLLCLLVGSLVSASAPLSRSPLCAQAPPKPAAASSGKDEVKANHILVATKEEAETIRKEIVAQGNDKKAFTAAARKFSKDVTTKTLGGDVGWFRQGGQMERAFTDTAYALKVGEMSEPVQTPFGWHIIFLTDRREIGSDRAPNPPPPNPTNPTPNPVNPAPTSNPPPTPNPVPPDANTLVPAPNSTPPVLDTTPKRVVEARRTPRLEQMNFRLTLETVRSQSLQPQQNTFAPEQAAEINLSLKNESSKEQKFFARELLALGFKVTALGEQTPIAGDFSSLAEPASYFMTLKPYEISGLEVSLNDYWKALTARRYSVSWDVNTLTSNLDQRFPKAKDQPDYAVLTEAAKRRFPLVVDTVYRDMSPRILYQRNKPAVPISIFEALKPDGKYYAQIKLSAGDEPLVIQLYADKQLQAVRHFTALVMDGFYDGLDFFDSEEGDYLLGGDPTKTGTGAPTFNLPTLRNDAKISHKRGTVSFVSRNIRRKGPVPGGQVGSIFAVCLKPHPEWDDEHVPFGEVISGLEQLEKQGARTFREITILTEDQLKTKPAAATPSPTQMVGNPEAVIKTSKGAITLELFEDAARNTVANFITLAGEKFYDKATKNGDKQKFFVMKDDAQKPFILQTGSPTNDLEPSSGPGYGIPSEVNAKKHIKGAVAMCVAYDETNKIYVPDTAGSQFFICLGDLPYYDYLKSFTIYAQVSSGLDVLDKLTDADTIESIEITKKKPHPYTPRKIASP